MPSEIRRGAIRIASNYGRLFATILMGLWLVRLLLETLGRDGYGLIALLGSTVGFAAMMQQIARFSMIRELGAAYHDTDPDEFARTYNSALAICVGFATVSFLLFIGILLIIPLLNIPPELVGAARWLVFMKGLECFVLIATAPQRNMYLVTERMVLANLWRTAGRFSYFSAALAIALMLTVDGPEDIGRAIVLYATFGSGFFMLLLLCASVIMVRIEPRLIPRPRLIQRSALKSVMQIGGWNLAVQLATTLHLQVGAVIVNVAFGLALNAPWGIAVQLASYVRMFTNGMFEGLDAVAARMSAGEKSTAVVTLTHHSTRLNALVSFPFGAIVLVLSEPILQVWLFKRIQSSTPEETLFYALLYTRIIVFGTTARAIADGWTRILYGAGFINRYAPIVLVGGVLIPILACLMIWLLPNESVHAYAAPATAYAAILVIVYVFTLPIIVARCLEVSYVAILRPAGGPLLIAVLCSPILFGAEMLIEDWSLALLALVSGLYGGTFGLISLYTIISAEERRLVFNGLRRQFKRGGRGGGRGRKQTGEGRERRHEPPRDDPEAAASA